MDLRVVLVRSIYDSNIGASSRAMANMGLNDLILVAPQTDITIKAHQAAATGQSALENRKVYSSWQEFNKSEGNSIRVALTARDGKGRLVRDLKETLQWLKSEEPRMANKTTSEWPTIHFVFGPEDWGLSSDDLEHCHFACSLPTYGENPSLNLAQAVLLALFISRDVFGGSRTVLDGQVSKKHKSGTHHPLPEAALKLWLQEMGFDVTSSRFNVFTTLKRMLLHNVPSDREVKVLETVLQQGIRKLKEYNQLRAQAGLPHIDTKSD